MTIFRAALPPLAFLLAMFDGRIASAQVPSGDPSMFEIGRREAITEAERVPVPPTIAPRPLAEVKADCDCLRDFFAERGLVPFYDVYAEAVYWGRVDTVAFYGQMRVGVRTEDYRWEFYNVIRASGDTRTGGQPFEIYNDNYLFTGVGIDYWGLLPGTRLVAQAGYSFDLVDELNRAGFDSRLGAIGYWEVPLPKLKIVEEIYADALYVGRYRYALATAQFRTLHQTFGGRLGAGLDYELGPIGTIALGTDTGGMDYNRYAELRLGARFTVRGPVRLAISPQYVWGTRWERPTPLPTYRDFRILATAYCGI